MTAGTMTGTETGIETETETGIGEPGIVCQEEEKMIETASDMTGVEVILTLLMTIGEPAGPFLHDVQVRAYPSSLDNNLIWFLDRYRSRSPRSRRPFSPPRRPRYSRSPPPSRRHMYNDGRACTRQGKHCMKLIFFVLFCRISAAKVTFQNTRTKKTRLLQRVTEPSQTLGCPSFSFQEEGVKKPKSCTTYSQVPRRWTARCAKLENHRTKGRSALYPKWTKSTNSRSRSSLERHFFG
jgi:hypothetical protein